MSTLEEVCAAFEFWRASRRHCKEPIPERLWVLVRALSPHYKKSTICNALKLSGGKFNEYCVVDTQKTTAISTDDGFAVGDFGAQYFDEEICELTLKGLHKSLQIKTTMRNVAPILSLVERYL